MEASETTAIIVVVGFIAINVLWLIYSLVYRVYIRKEVVASIVNNLGLEPSQTFYTKQRINWLQLYTFSENGLRMIYCSNAFLPKLSIVKADKTIPYSEINSVDLGQNTLTIKLDQTISLESLFFRWGDSVARVGESINPLKFLSTSPQTRKVLKQLFNNNSVKVNDVAITKKSLGLLIVLTVAVTLLALLVLMYLLDPSLFNFI